MECHDAVILINGHIDHMNTSEEDAALQSHLSRCSKCRRLLAAYVSIDNEIRATVAPAPEGFSSNVMSRICDNAPTALKKKRRPMFSIGTAAGLVAAVLVLLVGTGVFRLPNPAQNNTENYVLLNTPQSVSSSSKEPEHVPNADMAEDKDCIITAMPTAESKSEMPQYGSFETILSSGIPHNNALPEEGVVSYNYVAPDDILVANAKRKPNHSLLSSSDLALGKTLSEQTSAPVLMYGGVDEAFFSQLIALDSGLSPLLDSLVPVIQEDGSVCIETDFRTLMALQEWFCLALSEQPEAPFQRYEELGLDGSHIASVFTFPEHVSIAQWPTQWPEDWTVNWLEEKNWSLFYPYEGFSPSDDDLAYFLLIPVAQDAE